MNAKELLTRQLEQSLRIEDAKAEVPNPRGLPDRLVSVIITAGRCPMCLGFLDTWKCVDCTYDAEPWFKQSKAKHDRAWDRREG